jgi:hypothetical protein
VTDFPISTIFTFFDITPPRVGTEVPGLPFSSDSITVESSTYISTDTDIKSEPTKEPTTTDLTDMVVPTSIDTDKIKTERKTSFFGITDYTTSINAIDKDSHSSVTTEEAVNILNSTPVFTLTVLDKTKSRDT